MNLWKLANKVFFLDSNHVFKEPKYYVHIYYNPCSKERYTKIGFHRFNTQLEKIVNEMRVNNNFLI